MSSCLKNQTIADETKCIEIALYSRVKKLTISKHKFWFQFTWPVDSNTTSTCKVGALHNFMKSFLFFCFLFFLFCFFFVFLQNFEALLLPTQWKMKIIHIAPFVLELPPGYRHTCELENFSKQKLIISGYCKWRQQLRKVING